MMTIYAHNALDGNEFSFEVSPETSVKELKDNIAGRFDLPSWEVEMMTTACELEEYTKIGETALCEGDVVSVKASEGFLAEQALKERGLTSTVQGLEEIISSGRLSPSLRVELISLVFTASGDPSSLKTPLTTPLHMIAATNLVKVAEYMLPFFSVDGFCNGLTPLHVAAINNRPKMVEFLLEHNASKTSRTPTGDTPLNLAEKWDSPDAARALRSSFLKKPKN